MAVARTTSPPEAEVGIPGAPGPLEASEIRDLLAAAAACGLLGTKDRQMGGRFPSALVDAAQRASGITEPTDLLTYALVRVAFEDNYGERLLTLEGSVPRGTFIED